MSNKVDLVSECTFVKELLISLYTKKRKKNKQTPKPRDTLIVGDKRGEIKSMSEDVIQRNGRE